MDLLSLGTLPIDPDSPGGSDVRYESSFEELQAEVDKLSLPSASGEVIDWQKVSDLAAAILAEEAKDLLVAAYFGVARIHLEQYQGLQQALQLFADLLENFWDTLFPKKKRMRGRLAAVEWWIEKSETALEKLHDVSMAEEEKTALYAGCERLEQLLADQFPEPPGLRSITRILDSLAVTAASATAEPGPGPQDREAVASGPEPSPATAPSSAAAPVSAPTKTALSPDNAEAAVQSGLQTIRRAVPLLRKNSPAGPLAYRLLRMAVWSPVDSLPPATDGKTLIPPPDPQTAAMLQDIAGRGDWGALVQAAETQLSLYIFWLDLNRYSGVALERLGPPYRAAADAVCLETAGLLQRLPGLEKLTFADGTPLADQQTLDWLQTIFPGAAGATDISLADAGSQGPADDRFTEIFDQARNLVEENKLVKAVALLQEEMQHSFSACDRLRWRLALVRILITSKNSGLAMPHFDQLVHDIDTYRLESWDPDLALTCFKVILAGLKTLRDKTAQQMGETILHRIARLDPLEALRQGKG